MNSLLTESISTLLRGCLRALSLGELQKGVSLIHELQSEAGQDRSASLSTETTDTAILQGFRMVEESLEEHRS